MNLQLSDGTTMQIPDDATPDAIKNFSARGEQFIKANPRPTAAAAPAATATTPNARGLADTDPYSAINTTGRIASEALTGIPDLGIAFYNAFVAPEGGRVEPLGVRLRRWGDIQELPEDASYLRRIGEGIGSNAPYGLAGAGKALLKEGVKSGAKEFALKTALPVVTSDAGARVGGAIGGERGALIGGLVGGVAPGAKPMGESLVQRAYTGRGDPNAAAIAAAADRLGIEPTAGALGNFDVQKRENAYAATSPSGLAAREQQRIRNEMTGVGEDIGAQRGGTGNSSVAAVGDDITAAAAQRVAEDRAYSSAQQENLQRTIGDATQVPITDIITAAVSGMTSPNATVPMRNSLRFRLEQQLYPLINRHPDGTPILDANGNATVPYGALKGWRSDLGRSFDQGNQPRARELYGPATDAMAGAAEQAGVPRGDFNAVQQFTRQTEGAGGLVDRMDPYTRLDNAGQQVREPRQVYNWTLEGGLNNPERLSTFATETAGDPRQARVFGNYLQQKVGETLGGGQAQGLNKFAQFVEGADPRAINTIAGPQAPRLADLATLARGTNVPTSQRGLATSVGGVANTAVGKWLGSEALGRFFGLADPSLDPVGRGIGLMAKPLLDYFGQRIQQSDAAKRGMIGAPMPSGGITIQDIARVLSAIGQSQNQQRPPY